MAEFELTHRSGIPLALFERFATRYGNIDNVKELRDERNNHYRYVLLGEVTIEGEACGSYGVAFRTWSGQTTDGYECTLLYADSEEELVEYIGLGSYLCRIQVRADVLTEIEFEYADPGGCLAHPAYALMREIQDEARGMLRQLGLLVSPKELDY